MIFAGTYTHPVKGCEMHIQSLYPNLYRVKYKLGTIARRVVEVDTTTTAYCEEDARMRTYGNGFRDIRGEISVEFMMALEESPHG